MPGKKLTPFEVRREFSSLLQGKICTLLNVPTYLEFELTWGEFLHPTSQKLDSLLLEIENEMLKALESNGPMYAYFVNWVCREKQMGIHSFFLNQIDFPKLDPLKRSNEKLEFKKHLLTVATPYKKNLALEEVWEQEISDSRCINFMWTASWRIFGGLNISLKSRIELAEWFKTQEAIDLIKSILLSESVPSIINEEEEETELDTFVCTFESRLEKRLEILIREGDKLSIKKLHSLIFSKDLQPHVQSIIHQMLMEMRMIPNIRLSFSSWITKITQQKTYPEYLWNCVKTKWTPEFGSKPQFFLDCNELDLTRQTVEPVKAVVPLWGRYQVKRVTLEEGIKAESIIVGAGHPHAYVPRLDRGI
jgi:hypothetical protein